MAGSNRSTLLDVIRPGQGPITNVLRADDGAGPAGPAPRQTDRPRASKEQLHRELHNSRVAGTCNLTVTSVAQPGIDVIEVGMVQYVECLNSELQIEAVTKGKRLIERGIDGRGARPANRSIAGASVETIGGRRECTGIEPFAQR